MPTQRRQTAQLELVRLLRMQPLDHNNIQEYLTAWTQGELDRATSSGLRSYLLEKPEVWDQINWDLQLKKTAQRVLIADVAQCPPRLRQRIAAVAQADSHKATKNKSRNKRWATIALTFLFVGMIAGWLFPHRNNDGSNPIDSVIPVEFIAYAARIHAECSRLADRLHSADFPKLTGTLSADVSHDLATTRPYPDLSKIGFRYIGAGPCGDPMPDTVHLLYKTDEPGSVKAISLFVQEFKGQYPVSTDHLYALSSAIDPFPVLVWRTEHVLYFLLADDEINEQKAAAAIASTPKTSLGALIEKK